MNRVLGSANGGKAPRPQPRQADNAGERMHYALSLSGAILVAALLLLLSLRLPPGEPEPLQVRPEAPAEVPANEKSAALAQAQTQMPTHRLPPWRAAAQQ